MKKLFGQKKLMHILKYFIPVGLIAGVFLFVFDWLLEEIVQRMPFVVASAFTSMIIAVLVVAILFVSMALRKGKESVLEALPMLLVISAFYGVLASFNVAFVSFIVEMSLAGLIIGLSAVYLAEALWARLKFY